jgi:hypothetical protein
MDSTAPTATSAPLPLRADLLADAHCPHCGYSLRGLPENRCPECGEAFDPDELANAFVPQWPRLMIWYMVAWVLLMVLRAGEAAFHLAGKGPPGDIQINLSGLPCVNDAPVVILVGVPAIIGLRRRVDWARKTTISLLLLLAAFWLLIVIASIARTTTGPQLRVTLLAEAAARLFADVFPSVILAIILLTGLRSCSLRCSEQNLVPRLPLVRFQPRDDWPLLLLGILGGCALAHLAVAAHWAGLWHWLSGMAQSRHANWCLCNLIADSAVAVAFAAGALVIWHRPARTKPVLASLLGISLAAELASPILDSAFFHISNAGSDRWLHLLSAGVAGLRELIIPLVLYLYVSFALPPEAIQRVADPNSHPQCQVMPSGKGARRRNGAV